MLEKTGLLSLYILFIDKSMINIQDMWNRVALADATGIIFSVSFKRKHPKYEYQEAGGKKVRVEIEPSGAIRHMLCRRRVHKYTKGIIPPGVRLAEDVKCGVLTVFDLQYFKQLKSKGYPNITAGRKSYRRINLMEVVSTSLPEIR